MRIVSIEELRKTHSQWWEESYEMTYTLERPAKNVTLSEYVRKYKEGWCFYTPSNWVKFRQEDQDKINEFVNAS
jgi:hypothetical protein